MGFLRCLGARPRSHALALLRPSCLSNTKRPPDRAVPPPPPTISYLPSHPPPPSQYDTGDPNAVCVAVNDPSLASAPSGPLAAAGGPTDVVVADARCASPAAQFPSWDPAGVRSLSFWGPALVVGGCSAGMASLDMRAGRWQALGDAGPVAVRPSAISRGRVDVEAEDAFR